LGRETAQESRGELDAAFVPKEGFIQLADQHRLGPTDRCVAAGRSPNGPPRRLLSRHGPKHRRSPHGQSIRGCMPTGNKDRRRAEMPAVDLHATHAVSPGSPAAYVAKSFPPRSSRHGRR
jgi:hypothetical protein